MTIRVVSGLSALLARIVLRVSAKTGVSPSQEAVYQAIFERDLRAAGLSNRYYAVGAAANYSLLYLLLRSLQEFSFRQVVELGGGQSTLLFDEAASANLTKANILTVESDPHWRELLQAKVKHEVRLVGLSEQTHNGLTFAGYDLGRTAPPNPIELLVIDGPPGGTSSNSHSRMGALQILSWLDPENFLIIVDDAERAGEDTLCREIEGAISKRSREYRVGYVRAAKQQRVFAGGRFLAAAFF